MRNRKIDKQFKNHPLRNFVRHANMYFTEIQRVDPFQEINRLQHEMNRIFNGAPGTSNRDSYPLVNVWSDKEFVYVAAELPGVDEKDLNISIWQNMLSLSGEKRYCRLWYRFFRWFV